MSLKEIASLFKSEWIEKQNERCLNPRYRLAHCDVCVNACPQQAITISDTNVTIESMLCNNCGICVSDCPTGVFQHEHFDSFKLLEWARGNEEIHISCPASDISNGEVANIPCLGILTEPLLAALYGHGVERIYLYGMDACSACPTRIGKNRIDAVMQYSDSKIPALLQTQKTNASDDKGDYPDRFPKSIHASHEPVLGRRQFLSVFSRKSAAAIIPNAVKYLIEENNMPDAQPDIGGDEHILMHKHVPAIHRLSVMTLFSEHSKSDTSHFHTITANDACTGCRICAVRCPTGALLWHENPDEANLEFRALACIGCRLCISICPYDALSMSTQNDADMLRKDAQTTLFHSPQKQCANCGERFLAYDLTSIYCLSCNNEKDMNKQWSSFRITGPKDR